MLAALASTPAFAADKATREAQARFVEGLARVKAGDFEAARLSFAQAYVVLRKPDILWNLALSEEKSGHVIDALGHFRELGRAAAGEDRDKTKQHIDALMAQTGHIEVVAPSGIAVEVDGASAGVAPLGDAVDVLPGPHHVAAGDRATDTQVTAGEVAHVNFLVALPASPDAAAPPPAAVHGEAPVTPPPEAPPTPPSSGTPRVVATLAVGTLAVAGGVLGVTFGLQSQSNANTATQLRGAISGTCPNAQGGQCSQLKDAVDAENRDGTLSTVFYVMGGALAAGALATWLLWPKPSTKSTVSLMPLASPAGWGAGLVGAF